MSYQLEVWLPDTTWVCKREVAVNGTSTIRSENPCRVWGFSAGSAQRFTIRSRLSRKTYHCNRRHQNDLIRRMYLLRVKHPHILYPTSAIRSFLTLNHLGSDNVVRRALGEHAYIAFMRNVMRAGFGCTSGGWIGIWGCCGGRLRGGECGT